MSIKRKLAQAAAVLALGAATMGTAATGQMMPAAAASSQWHDFVRQSIEAWFTLDPSAAVYQGDHRFDGRLPDWTDAGLAKRAAFYNRLIADAQGFQGLSPADAMERANLIANARKQLFWMTVADQPHHNPAWYIDNGLDPNVYVSRDYADKPTRMRALIRFFDAIPGAASAIQANLKGPLPASFIKHGVSGFGGFAGYYRDDVPQAFADVKDAALQAQLKASSARAAAAMDGLTTWLKGQQGTATQDFALGPQKFSQMLRDTEMVDVPLDRLEAIGRADLARNQAALKTACGQYAPGQTIPACFAKMNADKPAGGPVAEASRQIPMLTAFVRSHDLVTIPGTEQALVRPSPPYNAQNSAYIDPPGPLEHGIPSIYYIAPPDPSWSKEKQLEYIPGKADLMFTTVHEVMPGHFLQFLHSNRAASPVGSLFVGYAFAEGWAHYSEEMMWEAGLGDGDPAIHIGQLSNALLRNCRFLSAIGLHTKGMTQAQSQALFQNECYQDEGNAEQQAARGTYDPAYLNYTLGKLMIRKLRADWTATHGGRAGWKAFHDQFLSYGGPPIPLVRQAMMGEATPRAVF
jgi:hypothetical protein